MYTYILYNRDTLIDFKMYFLLITKKKKKQLFEELENENVQNRENSAKTMISIYENNYKSISS